MNNEDISIACFGTYGSFHGEPVRCSPVAGCGLKGCPWQRPTVIKETDTVYAHVERTVHALCAGIEQELDNPRDIVTSTSRIKVYSEAVQALSSWPQFNPRDAYEQYQKLAEHHVRLALSAAKESGL